MTLPPCIHDCGIITEPPPDLLFRLPPPPVPAFLRNSADVLLSINGSCDFCNWARGLDLPYIELARQSSDDKIYFGAISACFAVIVLSVLIVIAVLRCRETKVKPVLDVMGKRGCVNGNVSSVAVSDGYVNGGIDDFDCHRPKILWSGLGIQETNPYTLQHQSISREEPESFAQYDYIDYGSLGHTYSYPGEVVRIVNDKENHYYYSDSLDVSFANTGFVDSENHATSL